MKALLPTPLLHFSVPSGLWGSSPGTSTSQPPWKVWPPPLQERWECAGDHARGRLPQPVQPPPVASGFRIAALRRAQRTFIFKHTALLLVPEKNGAFWSVSDTKSPTLPSFPVATRDLEHHRGWKQMPGQGWEPPSPALIRSLWSMTPAGWGGPPWGMSLPLPPLGSRAPAQSSARRRHRGEIRPDSAPPREASLAGARPCRLIPVSVYVCVWGAGWRAR